MKKLKNIEIIIPLCLITFMLISIITIKSSSFIMSNYYESFYLKQLSSYFISFILFIIVLIIGNNKIYKIAPYIYYFSCFLLVFVLFKGDAINSTKAWINIGNFTFQPSEFAKMALILYIGKLLNDYHFNRIKTRKNEFKLILKVFFITLVPSILVFLEPDTGSVISYFIIAIIMLFVSGIKKRWFVLGFVLLFILVFIFLYFFNSNSDFIINTIGNNLYYRLERIIDWKNNIGMQLENSMISIGSSGLFGYGLNNTPLYFPEPYTDFIFAVYASNYGLIGAILLLLIIIIFDTKIISIAIKSNKTIDKYIISGIIASLLFYQIQNISMTIGLLPITGIPLPFISYGGSSLMIFMILIAFVINAKHNR